MTYHDKRDLSRLTSRLREEGSGPNDSPGPEKEGQGLIIHQDQRRSVKA